MIGLQEAAVDCWHKRSRYSCEPLALGEETLYGAGNVHLAASVVSQPELEAACPVGKHRQQVPLACISAATKDFATMGT